MAYNLTDVIWLGRTGPATVTAVTTAGFFLWLLMSIFYCTKSGTEALVSQAVGRKDMTMARQVSENALTISLYGSILLNLLILVFSGTLLQFFTLEADVMTKAVSYLRIVSFGMCFAVINPVLSAIHIGFGNSKTPFIVNSMGLGVNIILDPIFIFGFMFIPALGALGAAIATVIANTLVFSIFIFKLKSRNSVIPGIQLFNPLIKKVLRRIFKIGIPITIHSVAFCLFSMCIGRIVSAYGTIPLGVQNVGAGIEALSWNTALGFSTALGAFTGQNYGAANYDRIRKGYYIILLLSLSLGLIATIAFFFFGEAVFSLFTKEIEMRDTGVLYLKILAVSQIFMCIEITSAGGFYGLGKSKPPSITSVLFTGLRVPAALFVVNYTAFAYAGVWWCISISSVLKGIVVAALYFLTLRKLSMPGTANISETG
ncbi:MAG: MATE family efflux transporter [Desulfobacter sp.]|nr:MAG: MATE family efflux transporter [Desulfobacter sp.]